MNWARFRWTGSWSGVVAFAFVAWAIAYFTGGQIAYALQRGNNLTEIIDSYSEANTIRAGEGYFDQGFAHNYGLPDLGYGNAFENQGGKHDPNLCAVTPCVYLHEPPGGEALIGAMTKMCGKGNASCLRIAPITVGFLSLVFFAWAATKAMGIQRCAFVFGTFYFAPFTTNGMHNLLYHSHVVSLIYVYSGFLLLAFVGPARGERWVLGGLFGVGFLYGCLTFDYVFHVMFLPVAFWLLSETWRADARKWFNVTFLACLGYGTAIILHLIQVRLYLGSWAALFADFGARAAMRLNGHLEASNPVQPPLRLLFIYWTRLLSEPNFLAGLSFLGLSAGALALLLSPRGVAVSQRWGLSWEPRASYKWAFVMAWLIPDMWLMVMRQHASVHGHFLPRNFVVVWSTGAIVLALAMRKSATETKGVTGAEPEEAPPAPAA